MNKKDIFYSEMISYEFTSEGYNLYLFILAKQGFLGNSGTGTFFKRFLKKGIYQQ